ncbi:kinase-like protein [Marasmius fiardii PR-910]|nr:kinase-like protein [Marasmius fiardii PR-910]
MKKLFGRDKPRSSNNVARITSKSNDREWQLFTPNPPHALGVQDQQQQSEWWTDYMHDGSFDDPEGSIKSLHQPALAPSRSSSDGFDPVLNGFKEDLQDIFEDDSKLRSLLDQSGSSAQAWLDWMQQLAEHANTSPQLRSNIFTAMLRLSKNSGLYPKCLAIQNVRKMGEYPIASGGFGDVWKGVVGDSTEPVCLKVVKRYLNSDVQKLSQEYLREAIVWRQLQHPNVLPFLGIFELEHSQQLCLISPWMEKGNLLQYLRTMPPEEVQHHTLAHDVANGLSYLHLEKIVHGDLKAINILITPSGRACIADFGLSRIADSHGLQMTTSTSRPTGTARWLAPELLSGGRNSKESDIYAYGCVCYEIFTGSHPFPDLHNEAAVVLHVAQGKHSPRPQGVSILDDLMWDIMKSCWNIDPAARPSAGEIPSRIEPNIIKPTVAQSGWDGSLSNEIRNNIEHQPIISGVGAIQVARGTSREDTILQSSFEKDGRRSQKQQEIQFQHIPRKLDPEGIVKTIGFLTATVYGDWDWAMVMDVCMSSVTDETNAEAAIRALRNKFKYGEPSAQLGAARLWAIMLRNSTPVFIEQSISRKFLNTVKDLVRNSRTAPVVRNRVLDVLAAAAYASNPNEGPAFRELWKKLKPPYKPDEGVPFEIDNPLLGPLISTSGESQPSAYITAGGEYVFESE